MNATAADSIAGGEGAVRAETGTGRLARLMADKKVVICSGSGGVGKTTISAALALRGAEMGRRACVVTIDPARRLANALGLSTLSDEPTEIDPEVWGGSGGSFSAMMLDAKTTFDKLVARYSSDEEQARRIRSNTFYKNIAGALSGTQEYMAMEKLYELDSESDFDLIVVDTPPTRNALDFLDAPSRLTKFLDAKIFRYVFAPTRGMLRSVSSATRGVLRTVAKVIGSEVIDDAVEFFSAFEGMYDGFKDRAEHVVELISSDRTAFVLVASARRDTVEEAEYFADKLEDAGFGVSALIINRVHPRFSVLEPGVALGRAAAIRDSGEEGKTVASLYENLALLDRVADREAENLAGLADRCSPAPVVLIPFLSRDVSDFSGLAEICWHLFYLEQ